MIKTKLLGSNSLKSKTQIAAMKVLEREETNAKKSRLSSLLLHQFIGKYGTKNGSSPINNFIKSAIADFLDAFVNVNDAEPNIPMLEEEIAQNTNRMKQELKTTKLRAREEEERRSNSAKNAGKPSLDLRSMDPKTVAMKELEEISNENQWSVVNAIQTVSEELIQQKEKQKQYEKKHRFKESLDDQLSYQKQLKDQQRRDKENQYQAVEQDLQLFNQESQLKKLQHDEHHRQERELRLSQIEEKKRQREYEKQLRVLEEKAEMQRAQRLLQQQEENKQYLKEKQKHQQELLKEENERNKEIKAQQLREQQAYEKKLTEDYERKLEAEERARNEAFKSRMDTLHRFASSYANGVGQQIQEQRTLEEQKTMEALRKKEEQDAERERLKIERRKQQAFQATQWNLTMVEQKRKQQQDERIKSIELRQHMEMEALEQRLKEKETKEFKRLQAIELKHKLDDQLEVRLENRRKERVGCSDVEMHLNNQIIKKLEEDPELLNKVYEKVKVTQMSSRGYEPGKSRVVSSIF